MQPTKKKNTSSQGLYLAKKKLGRTKFKLLFNSVLIYLF